MQQPPVADNAFTLSLIVGEEDVDAQCRASNVAVVRWMSRAAWAHSQALGYDLAAYERLGAWFVVRRHEIDYHGAARLGDELIVYTWPSGLGKATAERRHVIIRPADDLLIARGLNVWAFIDARTDRPRRIPPEVARTFDPARFA